MQHVSGWIGSEKEALQTRNKDVVFPKLYGKSDKILIKSLHLACILLIGI
jgi:hypothetical protein